MNIIPELVVGAGAVVAGLAWVLTPKATEPDEPYEAPNAPEIPRIRRWEFTDANGIPTGEFLPEGVDPHQATQDRSNAEGKSYGARLV